MNNEDQLSETTRRDRQDDQNLGDATNQDNQPTQPDLADNHGSISGSVPDDAGSQVDNELWAHIQELIRTNDSIRRLVYEDILEIELNTDEEKRHRFNQETWDMYYDRRRARDFENQRFSLPRLSTTRSLDTQPATGLRDSLLFDTDRTLSGPSSDADISINPRGALRPSIFMPWESLHQLGAEDRGTTRERTTDNQPTTGSAMDRLTRLLAEIRTSERRDPETNRPDQDRNERNQFNRDTASPTAEGQRFSDARTGAGRADATFGPQTREQARGRQQNQRSSSADPIFTNMGRGRGSSQDQRGRDQRDQNQPGPGQQGQGQRARAPGPGGTSTGATGAPGARPRDRSGYARYSTGQGNFYPRPGFNQYGQREPPFYQDPQWSQPPMYGQYPWYQYQFQPHPPPGFIPQTGYFPPQGFTPQPAPNQPGAPHVTNLTTATPAPPAASTTTGDAQTTASGLPKEVQKSLKLPTFGGGPREVFHRWRRAFEEYCHILRIEEVHWAETARVALKDHAKEWISIKDPNQFWGYNTLVKKLAAEFEEQSSPLQMSVMADLQQGPVETVHTFFRRLGEEVEKLSVNHGGAEDSTLREAMIIGMAWRGIREEIRRQAPMALNARSSEEMRNIYHSVELNMRSESGKMPRKLVGSSQPTEGVLKNRPRGTAPKGVSWGASVRNVEANREDDASCFSLTSDEVREMIKADRIDYDTVVQQRNQQLLDHINALRTNLEQPQPPPVSDVWKVNAHQQDMGQAPYCFFCKGNNHLWKRCFLRQKRFGPDPVEMSSAAYLPPYDLPYAPTEIRNKIRQNQSQGQTESVSLFSSYPGHPLSFLSLTEPTMDALRTINQPAQCSMMRALTIWKPVKPTSPPMEEIDGYDGTDTSDS